MVPPATSTRPSTNAVAVCRCRAVTIEAVGDQLDVDLQDGILTIELDSGGQYVINKHAPNRQIWMSSPVSGASHFDSDGHGGWVGTRGAGTLAAMLSAELAAATGETVDLG